MPLDLTLLSLYRVNGQELPSLPGLMAVTPPRKVARGREREPLIVSLLLSGNTPFSTAEYMKLASEAAAAFYNTSGALTTALRVAAETVNRLLLERNLATTGRGQYAMGLLTLASLRGAQLTLLQCGPTHVLALGGNETRHLHDPALSGKGLGLNQAINQYFSQIALQPGDRLLFCQQLPKAWEGALASDRGLPALESTRKRMMALAEGDLNAVLIQATEGTGNLVIHRPTETRVAEEKTVPPLSRPEPVEATPRVSVADSFAAPPRSPSPVESPLPTPPAPASSMQDLLANAHVVGRPPEEGPSAYAIPSQPPLDEEAIVEQLAEAALERQFPPSIPRLKPLEPKEESASKDAKESTPIPSQAEEQAPGPGEEPAARTGEGTRQAARLAVGGIQAWRRASERIGAALQRFLPRLLPGSEPESTSSVMSVTSMAFIAIAIPALIATIGIVMYLRFGRSSQYDTYLAQAQALRSQALKETDPARQRETWSAVLQRVAQAESFSETAETSALKQEAQAQLDKLLGVSRLNFTPAFAADTGAQISRMAASETDLYMLDAAQGKILRAALTGRGYEPDLTFDCSPGEHGGYTIGPMVDLLTLPKLNTLNSSVLGVDAAGNLLYCSPGQVPQVLPLTAPNTNWGRVTAMTLDSNKLYVLDAPSRAVWVYEGKDSAFPDPPYFYFGAQVPDLQDAIDVAANGDELYLLHADGRLTHCTFSRIESVPTRCDSPVPLANPFPAYGETDAFAQAHFTQMALTALPDSTLLLLDADGRSVYRISLRTFELQSILGAAGGASNPISQGLFSAMTVSPNHVLYVALGGQVYFTSEAP